MRRPTVRRASLVTLTSIFTLAFPLNAQQSAPPPILFELKPFPFQLDSNVSPAFNPPESMAGGVAVFDHNGDGRPDIFFTNGADLQH